MDDWRSRIWVDPDRRGGRPCVRGTRVAVVDVLDYLAGGMTVDELMQDFPSLARADIDACLAYAAEAGPAGSVL